MCSDDPGTELATLVTHGGTLSILGAGEPTSAASANVVKLAAHRRGRLGCLLGGQLAQLGEHTLRRATAGEVAGVKVAGVLASDLHKASLFRTPEASRCPTKTPAGRWFERVRLRALPGLPAVGRFQ